MGIKRDYRLGITCFPTLEKTVSLLTPEKFLPIGSSVASPCGLLMVDMDKWEPEWDGQRQSESRQGPQLTSWASWHVEELPWVHAEVKGSICSELIPGNQPGGDWAPTIDWVPQAKVTLYCQYRDHVDDAKHRMLGRKKSQIKGEWGIIHKRSKKIDIKHAIILLKYFLNIEVFFIYQTDKDYQICILPSYLSDWGACKFV